MWLKLLRSRQWLKNFFLFFPLIFSGKFIHLYLWVDALIAVAGFSLICSGMYILNDILDVDKDRVHPRKCKRILASGKIPVVLAVIVAIGCLALGFFICGSLNHSIFVIALFYVILHLFYNFFAKKIVILDVLTVAFGFQVRIWVGAMAVGVIPSQWLQMCVFILALFLGFSKRRHEIETLGLKAVDHRPVLAGYSKGLLDQIIGVCAALAIVFYSLYTISPEIYARVGGYHMVYSVGFVVYGVFRYLYLLQVRRIGDDPSEVLLNDIPLIINILLWISFAMTFMILHGGK